MYCCGDKVAHPGHGACVIKDIASREILGESCMYYVINPVMDPKTDILIPVNNAKKIGLRDLVSESTVDEILSSIESLEVEWINNHQKRIQYCNEKLKSDDLESACQVLVVLSDRETETKLTSADRDMMYQTKQKLISEISQVKGCTPEIAEKNIQCILERRHPAVESLACVAN